LAESEPKAPDLDEVDSGWEDEDDVDSGWEDAEAAATPGRASRELTAEEREARAAHAAKRKDRARAKVAEKAERRKARQTAAKAKQKKSKPRAASAPRAPGPGRGARAPVEERSDGVQPRSKADAPAHPSEPRAAMRLRNTRLIVVLVLLLATSCVIAFVLARR
jgi:cobalamin biosynthesis Mg chelatase CobN